MPDGATAIRQLRRASHYLFWLAISWTCAVLAGPVGASDEPLGSIAFVWRGTYGDQDGEGALIFPIDVDVDGDGGVVVLDHEAAAIKRYRPDGTYLDTLGRQGDGPGEFRRPRNVTVAADGRIWVFDGELRRFIIFAATGKCEAAKHFPGASRELGTLSDGSIVGHFRFTDEPGWIERGLAHEIRIFAPDLATSVLVDSARIRSHQVVAATTKVQTNVTRPFPPDLDFAILYDGNLVTAFTGEYRLAWRSPDGAVSRITQRKLAPLPISRTDREAYFADQSDGDFTFAALLREKVDFPTARPCLVALHAGPANRLLVEVPDDTAHVTFDVFATGGDFLGRVRGGRPPGRLVYRHGRAYELVAITDDELPTVTEYDLVLTLGSAP